MIGIVVVSHSPKLAEAAVDLALEMVQGERPAIAIAAGAGDGVIGTDAVKVSEAIASVASPDGVLVMMDLGSAVLSAEMALEFVVLDDVEIRLTSAPFVEGLLAGLVRAAGGGTLDEVEREARGALAAKQSQLGQEEEAPEPEPAAGQRSVASDSSEELTIVNPDGVHARPAALIVAALSGLNAVVSITNKRTAKTVPDASSMTGLLTLGARRGDAVVVSSTGADSDTALAAVRDLVQDGFGELDGVTTGTSGADGSPATPAAAVEATTPRPSDPGGPLGVSTGRAVGPILHMPDAVREPAVAAALAEPLRAREADRITAAAQTVKAELNERAKTVTKDAQAIIDATALFASDDALFDEARGLVTAEGSSAERAVWSSMTRFAGTLTEQGGRMAERSADVRDIRDRIVAELEGRAAPGVPTRTEPFVLVARDLAPADTALLDPTTCLALVTAEGGPTSHTAILARSLGIPAIVAAPAALEIPDGTVVLVDGSTGDIVIDPDADQIASVDAEPDLAPFTGSGQTADGHRIELLANVGSPESVTEAVAAAAEGVGLFRTEFAFLDRQEAPSIEEQSAAYRQVLAAFSGKKVIVRTLDAGADKPLPFVTDDSEVNPALGVRGYRTSRRRPEVLDDQLTAIARAASAESAVVGVMAPMIDTVDEARDFAELVAAHGLGKAGVMIETPAAAMTAKEIFSVVDFVSLGTNDLAQYTMAADRLVGDLAALNDPWQPAVLRLVALVGEAGSRAGKSVGVCGEAAADPILATVLVGAGVTSLSMSPRALAAVADRLGRVTFENCQTAARLALAASTAFEARRAVTSFLSTV